MNAFPRFAGLQGSSRVLAAKTPAIPQDSEFDSQRKLDLPLVILHFCVWPAPIDRRFRERADVG